MATDRPVRILYANPFAGIAGAENALLELMDNLDRRLYLPHLLIPGSGRLAERCQELDIPTTFLNTIPPPGGQARDTYRTLVHNAWAIARLIRQLGIHLVHANSPRMAYHTGLAARLAGVPHVTHVRDFSNSPFTSRSKAWLLNHTSDRIVTVSKATQQAVIRQGHALAAKTRVVYDGLPPVELFTPQQRQALRTEFGMAGRFPLLAVVGSISHLKGQAVALQSLPAILQRYPQARLLLVGGATDADGEQCLRELKAQVAALGLGEQVVFTGFRTDAPLIMASIDILMHPAVLPDAFPHVLLEASAQQAVIVASDIGGIAEIIQDGVTGRLVPPNQPEQLAQVVTDLLGDGQQSSRMRRAAAERVKAEFSINQTMVQIQAIYEELLVAK